MSTSLARPLIVSVALLLNVASAAAAETVYPGKDWAKKTPAEVGMDAAKLREFSRFVGGRGCVIRHGYMVYTWGEVSRRADVASAAKPFYAHLLLKAVEDGKIESVDEKVARWEPRLMGINRKLDYKDRLMTWRHMANQTSCYQLVEKPGTAYAYNDWQMALFWDTLFLKVYGATYENVDEKVFHPLLTDPLGCQDNPTMIAFGTKNRPGRVGISARDFARFGLLYLRKGNWNGRQLLGEKLAVMAVTSPLPNSIPRAGREMAEMIDGQRSIGSRSKPDNQTDHFGSYSWLWWINGVDREDTRMFPDAPTDTFGAFGHGGPRAMWVMPGLDLVVSYNDAKMRRWTSGEKNPTNEAMKLVVAACEAEGPEESGDKSQESEERSQESGVRSQRSGIEDADVGPTELADGPRFGRSAKIELQFRGPDSRGRGEPNPFAVRFDVLFTGPSGKTFRVPGFYDGDGSGGLDGNVWKVRFAAEEEGRWQYATESSHAALGGRSGTFSVTKTPADAEGFWKWGRLEAVGTPENKIRYLKFRNGPYWLKAGCDDPENFLGNYKNYRTLGQRMAAVDFLAERGINSLYIMTHNVDGDDKDVWPWLGENTREAKRNGGTDARFDVAKLEEWRKLFEYMQQKGVVPYLVLEDDSAWKGFDRRRYYREIIARFGYLPAVLFNQSEESNENYRLSEALAHMRLLAEIDPYDHPRGIHNVNRPNNDYVDAEVVDFTSIQTGSPGSRRGLERAIEHNRIAIDWIDRCLSRKRRVLVANFDEARPEEDRRGWWSVYLGGGVWETHVREPYDRPLSAWEPAWTQLGGTRAFMESLPFWEMRPENSLVKEGRAFCLAKPGEAYALYLPVGGSVTVRLSPGKSYKYAWWDPANGKDGEYQHAGETGSGLKLFIAPGEGDWALRILAPEDQFELRSQERARKE